MKHLLAFLALLPAPALAHGNHPPAEGFAHGLLHAGPAIVLAILLIVGTYALWRGRS